MAKIIEHKKRTNDQNLPSSHINYAWVVAFLARSGVRMNLIVFLILYLIILKLFMNGPVKF